MFLLGWEIEKNDQTNINNMNKTKILNSVTDGCLVLSIIGILLHLVTGLLLIDTSSLVWVQWILYICSIAFLVLVLKSLRFWYKKDNSIKHLFLILFLSAFFVAYYYFKTERLSRMYGTIK